VLASSPVAPPSPLPLRTDEHKEKQRARTSRERS